MGLSEDKALQLFSWHAFKNDPDGEYLELSKAFVKYAGKLPLTLRTLGIFLCARDRGAWISTLDKLKKDPEETTFKTLLVSYDGLDDMTKNVFLDVACFHKGNDKVRVIEILDSCDFSGRIGIDVLVEKSLLYISGKNVEMHDLVQEMAWKIVRRKSKEPGRRSRLWLREDIFHVLKNNTGTEDIEGIVLHLPKREEAHCNFEAFSKMYNLKMIQFNLLFLSPGSEVLPNSLRFLEWRYYPSKSLPPTFEPDSLTVLSLPTSEIVQLWNGRKRLSNLKHMDLSFSKLIRTPDFTEIQNLERLVLEGCYDLIEIHPSIAALKRLKILNFKNCMSMKSLPSEIAMESLEFLSLSRSVNLKKIPEFVGDMKNLSRLILSETAIKEIPPSIGCLIGLVELHLDGCQSLLCVPSVISNCKSLKLLNMLGCSKLSKLPESLGVMDYLEELDLSRTALKELPSSLVHLKNFKKLSVSGSPASWYTFGIFKGRIPHSLGSSVFTSSKGLCSLKVLDLRDLNLCEGAVPEDIGYLSSLEELNLSGNNFVTLPESIRRLSKLSVLYLENCKSLHQLSVLPLNGTLYVFTDDSTSLSMLSVPPPKLGPNANLLEFSFSAVNCSGLVVDIHGCNGIIFSVLRRLPQGISRSVKQFHTVIPGSYIPEWFSNQSLGNSLTVEITPHSCGRVMGIALCAIFSEQTNPLPEYIYAYCDHFGIQCSSQHFSCRHWDSRPKIRHLVSDHLWVLYVSLEGIIRPGQITISFDTFYYSKDLDRRLIADLKPKKCGACLVYKQDVEALNGTATIADNIISHCKAMGVQL